MSSHHPYPTKYPHHHHRPQHFKMDDHNLAIKSHKMTYSFTPSSTNSRFDVIAAHSITASWAIFVVYVYCNFSQYGVFAVLDACIKYEFLDLFTFFAVFAALAGQGLWSVAGFLVAGRLVRWGVGRFEGGRRERW